MSVIFALSDSEPSGAVSDDVGATAPDTTDLVTRQESSARSANSVAIVFRYVHSIQPDTPLRDVLRYVFSILNSRLFRLGGIAALLAFVLCWRLSRELRRAR